VPRSQRLGLRLADNGGLHLGRAHINAEFAAKQQSGRGGELGLRLEDLGRLLFQNKRARNKNPQKMCALVHQPGVQGEGGIWLIGLEEELLLQGVQLAELLAYHPEQAEWPGHPPKSDQGIAIPSTSQVFLQTRKWEGVNKGGGDQGTGERNLLENWSEASSGN